MGIRNNLTGHGVWMRILTGRGLATVTAAMLVVFGVSGSSWARTVKTRVHAGLRSSMHLKTHQVRPVVMHGEDVVPGVMPAEAAGESFDDANGARTPVMTPSLSTARPKESRESKTRCRPGTIMARAQRVRTISRRRAARE